MATRDYRVKFLFQSLVAQIFFWLFLQKLIPMARSTFTYKTHRCETVPYLVVRSSCVCRTVGYLHLTFKIKCCIYEPLFLSAKTGILLQQSWFWWSKTPLEKKSAPRVIFLLIFLLRGKISTMNHFKSKKSSTMNSLFLKWDFLGHLWVKARCTV